ncbi:MAG: PAS domain S-box protein, partial [Nitrospirota bacterium]
MNALEDFSLFQALAGAVLIFASVLLSLQIKKEVPSDFSEIWRKTSLLIFFFFSVYTLILLVWYENLDYPQRPLSASLFLVSACSIYFIIALVKSFVQKIREKNREIESKNNELEHEVEERRRAEEKLRPFEKAIETMQLGVTFVDPDGKIFYVNHADADMHGYTREELIGKDVSIYAPADSPKLPVPLKEITRYRRESLNVHKDGSVFVVQLMSDVVMNPHGTPVSIVTTCQDITERKMMEEGLKAAHTELEKHVQERTAELSETVKLLWAEISERKKAEEGRDLLAAAIEFSNSAVIITDTAWDIQYVNPAFERITG